MQERIARVQSLFYLGLFLMLGAAIGATKAGGAGGSAVLVYVSLAGALTAALAKFRLSRLQRHVRRHGPQIGFWATR